MVGRRLSVAIAVAGFLVVVAAIVSAQTERKAATLDDLLGEIQGLRADLGRTAHATMRMQLLIARLSLQEQRIAVLANQRADVSARLAAAVRERVEVETRVKNHQDAIPRANLQMREEIESALKGDSQVLSQRLEAERQLRLQETDLTGMIESERGRWQDFNVRLDELERSLPAGTAR